MSAATGPPPALAAAHRERMLHEGTVMVLYVSIVLLATLVALPEDFGDTGGAQLAGAVLVALATTVPILVVGSDSDVTAAAFAPALILGFAGYRVARSSGRSVFPAVFSGVIVLVIGLTVAVIKALISAH